MFLLLEIFHKWKNAALETFLMVRFKEKKIAFKNITIFIVALKPVELWGLSRAKTNDLSWVWV